MRAVTRPLGRDVDLNGFARGDGFLFVRDGVGLAGRGVAARVPLAAVPDVLAGMERDDEVGHPGCGPVALGVLPFQPSAGTELVIPAVTVGKDADGTRWITTIEGGDGARRRGRSTSSRARRRCRPRAASRVAPGVPVETYLAAVTAGRDEVRAGRLTKVVIARDVLVTADRPLDVHAILLRLRAAFGSSYRYSMEGFVGASPELLVARHGDVVRSHPLAGTAPRTGDPTNDARLAAALITSTKDQVEHRVVIDVVHETLLPWCSYLDWEEEPSIVAVANVQHLGTLIEGRLSSPPPNVLEMAQALSPTPALGGHPRDAALELIAAVEGFERGRYGGAVGWVDWAGNGTWAVAIRCAEIDGADRAPLRRRRHRGRQRAAGRAGRDAGQAAGHAVGHHPAVAAPTARPRPATSSGIVISRSRSVIGRGPCGEGVGLGGRHPPGRVDDVDQRPLRRPGEQELRVVEGLADAAVRRRRAERATRTRWAGRAWSGCCGSRSRCPCSPWRSAP